MWIALTLICAFVQALWMALSKRRLQTLPTLQFVLFIRLPVVALMAPVFLLGPRPDVGARFWLVTVAAAALECVRVGALARGIRRDYYATFSLFNMAPVFVLLAAPHVIGERVTPLVVGGVLCVAVGGLVFYRAGRFVAAGFVAAVAQGVGTTICKLCLSLSNPTYFMFIIFGLSTAMLLAAETVRSGLKPTARSYRKNAKQTLPIGLLNFVSIATYMFALNAAPATHFAVLFRTSLIFGFVLSLILLKEREGWRSKLAGAGLILAGSVFIILESGR